MLAPVFPVSVHNIFHFQHLGLSSRSGRSLKWRLSYIQVRLLQLCESRLLLFASARHSPWRLFQHVVHFPHYVLRRGCKLHVSPLLPPNCLSHIFYAKAFAPWCAILAMSRDQRSTGEKKHACLVPTSTCVFSGNKSA